MSATTTEDAALIARIARGETAALDALYDRYSRLVFSVVLTTLGDRSTAEEATLDAFMRVWRSAASYDPSRGKVSTWLLTVARHHAIDILRRGSTRAESRSVSLDDLFFAADPDATDPGADVELSAQRKRVREALEQLPTEQRQALALAYFKGLSQKEIADQLKQPLGTVKTRIRLAMSKLRTLLADEDDTPETSAGT